MIAFRITYLTGVARSADFKAGNDKTSPEWPPHPSRLFSALVSAWAAAGEPQAGRDALEWLERQGPPALVAGPASPRDAVVAYVPANDDLSLPATRRRNARRFPAAVPDSGAVHMVWPTADPTAAVRRALEHLALLVPSLGHPSSFVDVRLSDAAPPPNLVPADAGSVMLRVPSPGRLARLEELFERRRRPDAGRWQSYAPPAAAQAEVQCGQFDDMIVYRLGSNAGWIPLVGALNVCAAMRGAVLAHADQPIAEVISGHAPESMPERPQPSQRPHLAFVPIADVGHAHARGHLMGVAAVLPRGLASSERRACLRSLGRVRELTLGRLGRFALERLGSDVDRQAFVTDIWKAPSVIWATVTPLVLGRFPREPFGEETERVVTESCVRAGYPVPDDVEISRVSWVRGVPSASDFPARQESPGRPRRFHVHARLKFLQTVAGPVLVGVGRHYGYGFCRPLEAGR